MSSWRVRLFSALICFLAATAAGQPSCESVPDYSRCTGDAGDFCPRGIDCSCKDERAFCSCPYYKGPNADYWYMGSKCDYLWSTWDLVIVAVLPAVALAFIVAVTAQIIHCYKTTSKSKTAKEPESKSERQAINSHFNRAFVSEAPVHSPLEDNAPGDRFAQLPRIMQVGPGSGNHYEDVTPAAHNDPRSWPQRDYDTRDQRGPQQYSADIYAQIAKKNTQAYPSRLSYYGDNRSSAYGDSRSLPQPDYVYDTVGADAPQQSFRLPRVGYRLDPLNPRS